MMKNNKAPVITKPKDDLSKETYLTLKEASAYSHYGIPALRGYIRDRLLSAFKVRKLVVVLRADLDNLIQRSKITFPTI